MLTDKQITILWKSFAAAAPTKWQKDYLDFVAWARDAPESELRTEAPRRSSGTRA